MSSMEIYKYYFGVRCQNDTENYANKSFPLSYFHLTLLIDKGRWKC